MKTTEELISSRVSNVYIKCPLEPNWSRGKKSRKYPYILTNPGTILRQTQNLHLANQKLHHDLGVRFNRSLMLYLLCKRDTATNIFFQNEHVTCQSVISHLCSNLTFSLYYLSWSPSSSQPCGKIHLNCFECFSLTLLPLAVRKNFWAL